MCHASIRISHWPSGIAGSISHAGDTVGAAVCLQSNYRGIGLDIAEFAAVTKELFSLILTKDDANNSRGLSGSSLATLIFCCKESVYIAVNPITSEFLDLADVSIKIGNNCFSAKCDVGKASSQLVASGRGILDVNDSIVKALFLID